MLHVISRIATDSICFFLVVLFQLKLIKGSEIVLPNKDFYFYFIDQHKNSEGKNVQIWFSSHSHCNAKSVPEQRYSFLDNWIFTIGS